MAAAEAVIAALNPIAQWDMVTPGSGTSVTDRSGNGNALTLTAGSDLDGPTWGATGIVFDGDEYATAGGTLGITNGARTVIATVAPGDAGAGITLFSVGWAAGGGNFTRWTLRCASSTDDFRLEVAGSGETESALNFDAGTWAFMAAKQTGTNLNTCTLYKDGETPIALSTNQALGNVGNFLVGAHSINVPTDGFASTFGYVVVFNYALTDQQISSVRSALKTIMAARGVTLP